MNTSSKTSASRKGKDTKRAAKERQTKTLWQRIAGTGVPLSIAGSALGVFSAMNELIPTLTRVSMFIHWLLGLYQGPRDWAWQQIAALLTLVGFAPVEIPAVVKDAFSVGLLIFAAVNFESIRRSGHSFIYSVVNVVRTVMTQPDDKWLPAFRENDLLIPTELIWAVQPIGWVVILTPVWFLIASVAGFIPSGWLPWIFLLWLAPRLIWPNFVQIPTLFAQFSLLGFVRAWRSVVVALAIVAALLAINLALAHWLDPVLRNPPQWLQDFTSGDPSALPKGQ